jgi:hypothetical protein
MPLAWRALLLIFAGRSDSTPVYALVEKNIERSFSGDIRVASMINDTLPRKLRL